MKTIKVSIRDAENIIFNGDVDRISSYNEIGRFDIFPMHANFISIIYKELTLFNKHEKIKELKIEQAILKVKQDNIHIFLGIESLVVDEENATSEGKNGKPSPKNAS